MDPTFILQDLRHPLKGGLVGGGLVALGRPSSFRPGGRRPRQVFPPIGRETKRNWFRLFGHRSPNKGIASEGTEATRATSAILRSSPFFANYPSFTSPSLRPIPCHLCGKKIIDSTSRYRISVFYDSCNFRR